MMKVVAANQATTDFSGMAPRPQLDLVETFASENKHYRK
jgi:hypothetical protein